MGEPQGAGAGEAAQRGAEGRRGHGLGEQQAGELFCTTRLARCERFHAKVLTQ